MPQKIDIINASTVLKDSQIELIMAALQTQVSRDFSAAWGLDADLKFVPTGTAPDAMDPEAWQLVVLDNSDQAGALGYHDFTSQGLPIGKVFAGTDIQYGNSWMVTISHELLEMLADPEINLCAMVDGKLYAYEACDAVEDDALAYRVDNVLLSDFVWPSWFAPTAKGPYDQAGHVSKPLELAPGGYISVMNVYGFGWKQVNGDPSMQTVRAPVGSRRERRTAPRELFRRSTR